MIKNGFASRMMQDATSAPYIPITKLCLVKCLCVAHNSTSNTGILVCLSTSCLEETFSYVREPTNAINQYTVDVIRSIAFQCATYHLEIKSLTNFPVSGSAQHVLYCLDWSVVGHVFRPE